ncbi:MAG: magnesium transporter [Bacillota bacterium]
MRLDMELVNRIQDLVDAGRREELCAILKDLHPVDLAELLAQMDSDTARAYVLLLLPGEDAALVMQELEYDVQSRLLETLEPSQASRVLEEMSSDDLADLLAQVQPGRAQEIMELLEDAEDVRELLTYKEDSAGGIMTTEFIALQEDMTAHETIETLRRLAPDAETVYYLYVINGGGRLTGVLSLRDLIVAQPQVLLKDIMETNVVSVDVTTDQEEVAKVVSKYDLLAVPVVGHDGVLEGIVTFDDVIDVLEQEATEDIYRMAGAGSGEADDLVKGGPWLRMGRRLPWLVILLFVGFLSANVIRGFASTLESVVALAYFIPVLIDMGGNVGTQSFAVVVRGLATGEVERKDLIRVMLREAQVGVLLGVACGTLVALAAFMWQGSPILGAVVGLSMSLTLLIAAVVGAVVPMVVDRFGMDSAVASGPLITTIIDVSGLLIYFSMATSLMERLI